eukprot:g19621.t1
MAWCVRRVLLLSFLLVYVYFANFANFLGPQPEQGRRSKPRAEALRTDPAEQEQPVSKEDPKAMENALWTLLTLAFWITFYRTVYGQEPLVANIAPSSDARSP